MKTRPKGCTNQSITKGIEAAPLATLNVHVITTESEFSALSSDWDHLHQISSQCGLFNSWYWNRLWWQHYGHKGSLLILVASIHERIVGIAPLYKSTTRSVKMIHTNTVQFIGSGGDTSPDDLCVICDPHYEIAATTAIGNKLFGLPGIERVRLSDVDETSLLFSSLLHCAKASQWNAPLVHVQRRLMDDLPVSVQEFEQNLSRNARKQRKRRRAKLASAGDIVFKFCSTPQEVEEGFKALINLHQRRFSNKGGSDAFQTRKYRDFHIAVMNKALEHGELKLLTLKIDGHIAGVEYAFLCKGTLSFFQTGFDPQFQHLSLGHLLMMHTIDQSIVDGASRIDLLKGDYAYKSTYAKQTRKSADLDFWKNRFYRSLVRLAQTIKQQVNGAKSS